MATDTAAQIKAAKFDAFLNGAYQAGRESYLDGWHRALMFGVILLGTSSVADILSKDGKTWAAIVTAGLAAADLVFDFSVRARTASFLRKRYFEIAACLEDKSVTVAQAQAALLRLSADEEPPYMAAHAVAENWATGAIYGSKRTLPCRVSLSRRLARHVFHHTGHDFSVDAPPSWGHRFGNKLKTWVLTR